MVTIEPFSPPSPDRRPVPAQEVIQKPVEGAGAATRGGMRAC